MKSSLEDIKHDNSMLHPKRLLKFNAYFLKQVLPRATRTMLIPEAAICRANSLPIPDEAPVTSAHGPTSLCRVLLSSLCSVLPA